MNPSLYLLGNSSIVPEKQEPFEGKYLSDPWYMGGELYTTLPPNAKVIIPTKPRKDYFISNWWGVEIPGLPFIPGVSSSEHPTMLMSYVLPHYDSSWYEPSIIEHAKQGNSHFCLSWGVAYEDLGWSKEQFRDLCLLVKQYIPYCHVMIAGKSARIKDKQWGDKDLMDWLIPVTEELLKNNALDTVSMFEMDAWNIPGTGGLDGILKGYKSVIGNQIDFWAHFNAYVTAWPEDGATRAQWWNRQVGILKGLLYQGNVNWNIAQRQEIMQWTTAKPSAMPQFADGTFKFVACELDGMSIFDTRFSSLISRMHGWEYICTPGDCPIWGTCSGLTYPNGNPILNTLEP